MPKFVVNSNPQNVEKQNNMFSFRAKQLSLDDENKLINLANQITMKTRNINKLNSLITHIGNNL